MTLRIDSHIKLTKKNRGILKGAFIDITYDDTEDVGERLDVDLVFPFFEKLVAIFTNTANQGAYHTIASPLPMKMQLASNNSTGDEHNTKSGTISNNSTMNKKSGQQNNTIVKSISRSQNVALNRSCTPKVIIQSPVSNPEAIQDLSSQNSENESSGAGDEDNQSQGYLSNISMPDGQFEHMSCGEFLKNVLPLLTLDVLSQLAIERLLLRSFSPKNIVGETLEALGFVSEQTDGSYRCEPLIDLFIDPRGHFEEMMYDFDPVHNRKVANVGTLLKLGAVVRDQMLACTRLSIPQDPDGQLTIPLGWNESEFANLVFIETVAPGGVTVALRNPVKTVNGVTKSTLGIWPNGSEIQFNLQANFLPTNAGYGMCVSGASFSANIDLHETAEPFLLRKKLRKPSQASTFLNPFMQGSNISLTASIGGTQTILPIDADNLPTTSQDNIINAIFDDDTANVTLSINLDGQNNHNLTLLPDLDRDAAKSFFSGILSSTIELLLPHLITVIIHRLKAISLDSQSTTLGDELIGVLDEVGLWNTNSNSSSLCGIVDPTEFGRLIDDPNQWLLGFEGDSNNQAIQGKLPDLFSSVFKRMTRFTIPDASDVFTIVETTGSQGKALTRILWHPNPDPKIPPYLTLDVGENEWEAGSSDVGFWLKLCLPDIPLTDEINLILDGLFSIRLESAGTISAHPSMFFEAHTSAPIVDASEVKVNPALRVNWSNNQSTIEAATNHSIKYTFTGAELSEDNRTLEITNFNGESHTLLTDTSVTIANSTSSIIGLSDADTPEKRLQALYNSLQLAVTNGDISLVLGSFNPGISTELMLLQTGEGSENNIFITGTFDDLDSVFKLDRNIDQITFIDSTTQEQNGYGFWLKVVPEHPSGANLPPIPTAITYGAESKPAESVVDTLLPILLEVRSTRDFLTNPIAKSKPNSDLDPAWASVLETISTPAIILNTLCVGNLDYDNTLGEYDFTTFSFHPVSSIRGAWEGVSPLKTIFGCFISIIESGFQSTGDQSVPIFKLQTDSSESSGKDPVFEIRLVDGDEVAGQLKLGIQFEFDNIEIILNKLRMVLYTEQNPDVWTEEANMQGGINFYFATWTSNSGTNQNTLTLPTSQISPHFSIEVGGLGVRFENAENKPLLDKTLQLNSVSAIFAMDYKIVDKQSTKSLPYCEAGGKLELDNFGLLLSGDPDSDGGNDFAKSLLQGE